MDTLHISQIKDDFAKMQTRQDLLNLLNKVKPLVYGNKAVSFDMRQLTWYSNPKINNNRYKEFKIKKKSGSLRTIHAPVQGLKAIQKTLSFVLQCVFQPHPAAMGFVLCKSIVDNATLHEGSNYVYNIDLKDFFQSIDQARVWKCFQLKPFDLVLGPAGKLENERWFRRIGSNDQTIKYELTNNRYLPRGLATLFLPDGSALMYSIGDRNISFYKNVTGFRSMQLQIENFKYETNSNKDLSDLIDEELERLIIKKYDQIGKDNRARLANLLAVLCCTSMQVERKNEVSEWEVVTRNVLPQGAPTSPVITNIVCKRLDYLLSGVAKRFGLKYSRYADDITFSSMHNVYQPESEFLKELHRIIAEQNFHIKESKTRLQKDGYRKEVTGLLVNDKANVQQRYIKQLRMWLYYWERYGYERASGFFLQQYVADKGHIKNGKPDMANVISGKLDYLKMVKGADNELYLKLKGRFDILSGYTEPINQVLSIWANDGINQAMDVYYKDKLE